ncbi:glycerophosphodiester phosphodiesterase [Stieleria sp. TO1_6]|uniref:glycerophosphodiester phosphodiesterase n=1 Tax=Stieleria tagensis TaxID=2956795 RepID=UPI00209B650A|nr:glycerophosphodiester phosphodiesterase [Stieleria tagensis]MCO8124652.1 glycerophosphodiester phosphodiesterase [Stieleria tagensis]
MRFPLVVLTSILLIGSTVQAQQIIAHRGASFDAPENTVAAFQLAWQQQADGVEGDFYLTADNEIVCIHDKTSKRVAPEQPELSIATSTLAELRNLDVGSWKDKRYQGEKIPTLAEVIATIPEGKTFFVEIKCGPEIVPVLKQQLADSGLSDQQIVIICFNQEVIRQTRQQMPQYKSNWLTSYKLNNLTGRWSPSQTDVIKTLKLTGASGLGSKGERAVVTEEFITAVQSAGSEVHVWTINDAALAREFGQRGAASITTDRPAFIREALGQTGN